MEWQLNPCITHDAQVRNDESQAWSAVGVGVGCGGLAEVCGAAAVIATSGAGPIGWVVLFSGVAAGVGGCGLSLACEIDQRTQLLLRKNSLVIKECMAVINETIQSHFAELSLIDTRLKQCMRSSNDMKELVEDEDARELVLDELPGLRSEFENLEFKCDQFLLTEENARKLVFERLGLEA